MNKFIPIALLSMVLLSQNVYGQDPTYKEMMDDPSFNFYEVVSAAESYFEMNGTGKGSGFKGFERWRNENESKFYPSGDRATANLYLPHQAYRRLQKNQDLKTKTSFPNGWKELGPWDANNVTSHYSPGIGRVETFWVNPNNENQIYLGSRSGGFWKTNDGGTNWTNTTDTLPACGVFSLAVNPTNSNDILIGTQQGGNNNTHGIYRSKDGGNSWVKTAFNPDNLGWGGLGSLARIYKLAFHPTIANRIYIGTNYGLFVSTDDLLSYSNVVSGAIYDIEFHPTKSNVVYMYNHQNAHRKYLKVSTDTGFTFTNSSTILDSVGTANSNRAYIAVTAAQPNYVYFASSSGLRISRDEGMSFNFMTNPGNSCFGYAVSDQDTLFHIYGYVNTEASTNGGYVFSEVNSWSVQDDSYVHADIRAAEAVNGNFYLATDGYLAKSTNNGTTWTLLNDGTGIREFYAVGLSQSNSAVHMAGSQDNGTSILNANGWIEWNGGDGMEALIQPLNPNWMIGSWQFGTRNLTHNGGQSRFGAGNPEGGSSNARWEAPLLLDPINQMVVYHFGRSVFKGSNFGQQWDSLSSPFNATITEAAIAENNNQFIVACSRQYTRISTDGGYTWSPLSGLPIDYWVTDVAFDPKDDSTILVTYNRYQNDGNKIFISHDLGSTWTNITYNLNNMPLRTVVMDRSDSGYIYVGGEIGVYYKSLNGVEWTLYNDALPNVTVKDLEIHYGSNSLKAATWGRGLWEYTTVGRNESPSIVNLYITSNPTDIEPKANVAQELRAVIEYDWTLPSVYAAYGINSLSLNDTLTLSNIGNEWVSETSFPTTLNPGDNIYFRLYAVGENNDTTESYRYHFEMKELRSVNTEEVFNKGFSIIPNPNNGRFTIESDGELISAVRIMDQSGRMVYETERVNAQQFDSVQSLASGVYVVIIQTDLGEVSQKIVVN